MAKDIKIKFTIDGIEREVDNLKDFNKAMEDAADTTKDAEKQQGFFARKQEELNDRMQEFKATLGEVKQGFVNGAKGLKNFVTGFKTAGGAAKNFGRIAKAAVAATGIGLLLVAVTSLVEYFMNLEGGVKIVRKAMAGLGAVVGQLGKAFSALIKLDFKGALAAVKDIGTAVQESAEAVDNQFEAEKKLSELRQKTIIENAKLTQEIEKQKKVLEDSTLSTEERLAALDKVTAATKALAENQREETELALKQAEADLVNINNYEERRQKQEEIAQLQADLIDQTTQLSNIEYDAARVAREIRQQEADEKQRLHDEEMARIKEEEEAKAAEAEAEMQRQLGLKNALQQFALEDISNAYEKARAELAIQEQKSLDELALLGATQEQLNAVKESFAKKRMKIDKEEADFATKIKEAQVENDIQLAQGALGAVVALAGQGSAASKSASIAQTTIDTYVGAQKAFNSQFIPGDPTSFIRAGIAAASAVATGIANVKAILSTPTPGEGGAGGGGGVSPRVPSAPAFTPQTFDPTQAGADAGETVTFAQQGTQSVVKAYVVAEEVSSQQEANKRIDDLSRL